MNEIHMNELVELTGGKASALTCFALGFGAAVAFLSSNPVGWMSGLIALGKAQELGCFDD